MSLQTQSGLTSGQMGEGVIEAAQQIGTGMIDARQGKIFAAAIADVRKAQLQRDRISNRKRDGARLAKRGASGVDVSRGSPVETLAEAAAIDELDTLQRAWRLKIQEERARAQAKAAKLQAIIGGVSSVLQGAMSGYAAAGVGAGGPGFGSFSGMFSGSTGTTSLTSTSSSSFSGGGFYSFPSVGKP